MALNENIPLGFQPQRINTPFENLNIVLDTKRREQQVRQGDLELKQQEKAAQDQAAIQEVWKQHGNDPETAFNLITQINPELGFKLKRQAMADTIQGMELEEHKLAKQEALIDTHLNRLVSVRKGDDEAWQFFRGKAIEVDPDLAMELPQHLVTDEDVAMRDSSAMKGKTAGARVKAQREELNRLRDDALAAQKAAEAERKDKAAEEARLAKEARDERHQLEMERQGRVGLGIQAGNAPLVPIVGPDGKSILVPRQAAVGKTPAPTGSGADGTVKLPAAAQTAVAHSNVALRALGQIKTMRPNFTQSLGPVAGSWQQAKQLTPAADKGYASFAAELATLKNRVIQATTGAQMSKDEAKRILDQVPELTNQPDVFDARMDATEANLQSIIDETYAAAGGSAPSRGTSGGDTKKRLRFDQYGRPIP